MEMQGAVVSQQEVLENNKNKKYISDGLGCVELLECFGSDLTVANAARVSFNKEAAFEEVEIDGHMVAKLAERDAKLIKYLAQHRHNSPFFHPQVRMRIKMPIFVAREWFRHTIGFSRNEVSRRYVNNDPEFFVPESWRSKSASKVASNEPSEKVSVKV